MNYKIPKKKFWFIKTEPFRSNDWGIIKVSKYENGVCYGKTVKVCPQWTRHAEEDGVIFDDGIGADDYKTKRYKTIKELLQDNFDILLNIEGKIK